MTIPRATSTTTQITMAAASAIPVVTSHPFRYSRTPGAGLPVQVHEVHLPCSEGNFFARQQPLRSRQSVRRQDSSQRATPADSDSAPAG